MITPEVKTLFHKTVLKDTGGQEQQKIHATSVHVLSARKSNSYKKLSQVCEFVDIFLRQTSNPRAECSCKHQTQTCRHHGTPGQPLAEP